MIMNVSRALALIKCPHEAFNRYHRNLSGQTTTALLDGGAVHNIIAKGLASKDWSKALDEGHVDYLKAIETSTIPPEQEYLIESHWELVKAIIQIFHEEYEKEDYQVLQPECAFDLELPDSGHSCVWLHWLDPDGGEHWAPPGVEDIFNNRVRSPHAGHPAFLAKECPCWQPHRFVGRADSIMLWNGVPCLHEYKTTSIWGDMFWDGFELDLQTTAYMYGVQQATGLRPRSCVVAGLFRPSERQVSAWNEKRKYGPPKSEQDYLKYERRPFMKTEEDLARVEKTLISLCNEWEWRILAGDFRMSPTKQTCIQYGRKCDFHAYCMSHDDPVELGLMYERLGDNWRAQKHNYVDVKMEQLIQTLQGVTTK